MVSMKLRKLFSTFLVMSFIFSSSSLNVMAAEIPQAGEKAVISDKEVTSPSELKNSVELERQKTDRFIIKYKEPQNISKINKNNIVKSDIAVKDFSEIIMSDNGSNKSSAFQKITLNQSVNSEDFIKNEIKLNPQIDYIQPDYKLKVSGLEEAPKLGLSLIDWDYSNLETADLKYTKIRETDKEIITNTSQEKTIVAIIDTGIDITHQDLKDYIHTNVAEYLDGTDSDGNGFIDDINGWNFVDKNNVVYDETLGNQEAHGTQIAGIIAGAARGAYEISPDDNVVILPIKAFSRGQAYTSDIIDAIKYAEMMGAKVINCSFGSMDYNPALKEVIENSNALFICAAGNGRSNLAETPVYPAAFGLENIISVASINDDGGLSYFSNYSDETVDIAACGRSVKSTIPNDKYLANTGTSMSAGFVSAAAARILSADSDLDAIGIKNRIIDGADKISPLGGYVKNAARLNVGDAISGQIKNNLISLTANDDFNAFGYSGNSEQFSLLAGTYTGSGTISDPYIIENRDQLLGVNYNLSASYKNPRLHKGAF